MAKKIAWTASARADVRAIDRDTDIDPPEIRLKLGDYRVRFYDRGESIEILAVKKRKDAYK
jgi:hypothetical protein